MLTDGLVVLPDVLDADELTAAKEGFDEKRKPVPVPFVAQMSAPSRI